MVLENIVGNLLDSYRGLEVGTMLHSDALQAARLRNDYLRSLSFSTADGNIYHMKDGVPHLAMTRDRYNPILRHIYSAFTELATTGFHPSAEDVTSALASESTVDIDLTKLRLQRDGTTRCLAIPTQSYSSLNAEERILAERVHGSGDAFVAVMKMLADARIRETRVYVLNPDYVREHAKEAAIGRASWLNSFNHDSYFSANAVNIRVNSRIRGVRHRWGVSEPIAPVGRVAQGVDYLALYQIILADPEQAREALDDKSALALRTILDSYDSRRI